MQAELPLPAICWPGMKTFLKCTVFMGILSLAASLPAIAQDVLNNNNDAMIIGNNRVGVSGVVTDVRTESFVIDSSGNDIIVSTEEMNLDHLSQLIRTGMRVEIEGDMNDNNARPTIDAQQIRITSIAPQLTQPTQQAVPVVPVVPYINQNAEPIFIPQSAQ
jgi:hypothetical protein